jgi:hypothetical protein
MINILKNLSNLYHHYSVADPDPGSGAFLTPGSGIRDEHLGSYFREIRNNFRD